MLYNIKSVYLHCVFHGIRFKVNKDWVSGKIPFFFFACFPNFYYICSVMGKFSENIEQRKEVKEKDRIRREKLASYFYDSSKLVLAGVVIGGVTPIYTDNTEEINLGVVLIGSIATILLAWIGNKILK